MSAVPRLPAGRRPPWLGEHTAEVLSAELGMSGEQLAALRDGGVIA
jgi:crotonobetainyl-CoA:carnitine CoA-transferase CaiB-like acyl-CoA transferase